MALEARDLIYPRGVVKPEMFPGETLTRGTLGTEDGTVDVWLSEAEALTQDDKATRAYVYARAYESVADRMALEHASESMGRRSKSRSADQLAHFKRLAAVQWALFERVTGTARKTVASSNTAIEATF